MAIFMIRTNKPGDRIEIVNEDSSIEFVDDHYRKLEPGGFSGKQL